MANVIPIGEPVNQSERVTIAYLRDHLPDNYTILHNFEIEREGEFFEVDLAVIAPHAVYMVDVKGHHGDIRVYGPKWYPENRQPFPSPLLKLRHHAKTVKGCITASDPGHPDLRGIYIDAVVLLASSDAVLVDSENRDSPCVTTLAKASGFFQNASRIPENYSRNIRHLYPVILRAIQGRSRPTTSQQQLGNWVIDERVSATDRYTEYRAYNCFAGKNAGTVLLRIYSVDPYQPPEEKRAQAKRIGNAYKALNMMLSHPNIPNARDFFPTEGDDKYVLVIEDILGKALRMHIKTPSLSLTLDQKLQVTVDILSALSHAHAFDVVHRNLTPGTLLIGQDGRVRITGFDYARVGTDRSYTMAEGIVDDLEYEYQAPECYRDPSKASPASDVFSAGIIIYELFTGERPFRSASDIFDQSAVFSAGCSQHQSGLPDGFDAWLQSLCTFDPLGRPTAQKALDSLNSLVSPAGNANDHHGTGNAPGSREPIDYTDLPSNYRLTGSYVVQERLGKPGGFGVAYKIIDTLGDVFRVVKLILKDRTSTLERLRQEYRILCSLPEHPNVVKVIHADVLPGDGPPFIVFEYIDGFDVRELIDQGLLTAGDGWSLAQQVAEGLAHLHLHSVHHCDIKPRNLLWTDRGVKIIDFNVAVTGSDSGSHGGGSRRYLPPDLDLVRPAEPTDLVDRDLYALGVTLYEVVTGQYPWGDANSPLPATPAPDPRSFAGCEDLSPAAVEVMQKAVAPRRIDRYHSAEEMLTALQQVVQLRLRLRSETDDSTNAVLAAYGENTPNCNPFVNYLLTWYSQSQRSNSGTRGLDSLGEKVYIETALDRSLMPAVLEGKFDLVVITGNAGDGKTAFLQKLERHSSENGATITINPGGNGTTFTLSDHRFISNYDGSQDEGDRTNDSVLLEFLQPFGGPDSSSWPQDETRLIAINEGRLVDFLQQHRKEFPFLRSLVQKGLSNAVSEERFALVNLNLRSVVARTPDIEGSILERLLRRMTDQKLWTKCEQCSLSGKCYVHHNVLTFQDPKAGTAALERLEMLYMLTSLRGQLHITLRDLRSALAFMLVGTRDCNQIHELYASGNQVSAIADGFYFNSWLGGDGVTSDRLLSLLKEVDVGLTDDPQLDRAMDFLPPDEIRNLLDYDIRSNYDRKILTQIYTALPRDYALKGVDDRLAAHQHYVSTVRRLSYFERRDDGWKSVLPYRHAGNMLSAIRGELDFEVELAELLQAINREEGLVNTTGLDGKLALQVRQVENGTIRSYRIFPPGRFKLELANGTSQQRFVELMPSSLALYYVADDGSRPEMVVDLDIFEMLGRLNEGYKPGVEDRQGYYLSLTIFKNILGSAAYDEVLLTTTGHDFYRIERKANGALRMEAINGGM